MHSKLQNLVRNRYFVVIEIIIGYNHKLTIVRIISTCWKLFVGHSSFPGRGTSPQFSMGDILPSPHPSGPAPHKSQKPLTFVQTNVSSIDMTLNNYKCRRTFQFSVKFYRNGRGIRTQSLVKLRRILKILPSSDFYWLQFTNNCQGKKKSAAQNIVRCILQVMMEDIKDVKFVEMKDSKFLRPYRNGFIV